MNAAEIVNMRVANEADIPVLLVADVDHGGAIASVVSTLELLGRDRRQRVIFNSPAATSRSSKTRWRSPADRRQSHRRHALAHRHRHRGRRHHEHQLTRGGTVKPEKTPRRRRQISARLQPHRHRAFRFEPDVEIVELAARPNRLSSTPSSCPGRRAPARRNTCWFRARRRLPLYRHGGDSASAAATR
ncbi:MAG: hypothetical protein ACLUEQ_01765 [Cloacibacillus evryensis]